VLNGLNEGDWVALYDAQSHRFEKVARIEHKFMLSGGAAKTYKKNFVEVLMIRHKDRVSKTLDENGSVKADYIMVDAATGKELDGKHHDLIVMRIPHCLNLVFDDTGLSWSEMIEKQKIIYALADMDWKTMKNDELKKIYSIMFEAHLRNSDHESGNHRTS